MRETPRKWCRGFALHRRQQELDSLGEARSVYDMDQPDFVAEDGSPEAICWQVMRSWQSAGQVSSGLQQREYGQQQADTLQGACRYPLEVQCGDRFVIDGAVYELNYIQHWPEHRLLRLARIR